MKCKKKSCICGQQIVKRVKHFLPLLKKLKTAKTKERKAILKSASPCLVRLVSECGYNILKGNVQLPNAQYKKLKPYKRLMLFLSKPKVSIADKKEALVKKQGGAFPAVVLPLLLSAISGFAGEALAKSIF